MDDRICLVGFGVLAVLVAAIVSWATATVHQVQARIIRQETIISGYRAALRFYADEELYVRQFGTDRRPIEADSGRKAREMLGLEATLDRYEEVA